MTITTYQVDSVIKAYMKQNLVRTTAVAADAKDKQSQVRDDVVSISGKPEVRSEAYEKISYSLKGKLVISPR